MSGNHVSGSQGHHWRTHYHRHSVRSAWQVGAVAATAAAFMLLLSVLIPNSSWLTYSVGVLSVAVGTALMLRFAGERIESHPSHVVIVTWRRRREIPWDEVDGVVLVDPDGSSRKVTIPPSQVFGKAGVALSRGGVLLTDVTESDAVEVLIEGWLEYLHR